MDKIDPDEPDAMRNLCDAVETVYWRLIGMETLLLSLTDHLHAKRLIQRESLGESLMSEATKLQRAGLHPTAVDVLIDHAEMLQGLPSRYPEARAIDEVLARMRRQLRDDESQGGA